MLDAPAPAPPAIVAPAPREVSFGLVAGRVAPGTRRIVVRVGERVLADRPLGGTSFALRLELPRGPHTLRVTAVGAGGGRSSSVVRNVRGLPRAGTPRLRAPRLDPVLQRTVLQLVRRRGGIAGVYVEDLRTGRGAAWNARARFPAASTLKLAIGVTVLRALDGKPRAGSRLEGLLRRMLVASDNEAANELLAWLGGTTGSGSAAVDATMRALDLRDSLMYGGYETRERSAGAPIPIRVEAQPAFGVGKYTTAWDLARLARALYLAADGKGPLLRHAVTGSEARYLLHLLAQVPDRGKLGRHLGESAVLLHKAGWLEDARHDNGVVAFGGGAYVATVLTWRTAEADELAGRVAFAALERFGSVG